MSGSADPPALGVARRLMDWPSVTNFSNRRGFSGAKIRLWQVFANRNVLAVNLAYIVCGVFVFKTVFPYFGLDKFLIDGVVLWELVVVSPAQCFSVCFMWCLIY